MSDKHTPSPLFAPLYAAVGVTEAAVDALRRLGAETPETTDDRATQGRRAFAKLRQDATDVVRGASRVPDVAVAGVQAVYDDFVQRGLRTVTSTVPLANGLRREGGARVRAEEARARREARRLARQAGGSMSRGQEAAQRVAEDAGQRVERTVRAVRTEATRLVDVVSGGTGDTAAQRMSALRRAAVVDTSLSSTAPTAREESIGTDSGVSAGVEAAAATRARRVARAKAAAGVPSATTSVVARKAAEGRRAAGESAPSAAADSL